MIIDAMDMLYTSELEGFCLVSSDSDFTKLASRLRESGKMVIGMGEDKTPLPFRKACDIFTVLEVLLEDNTIEKESLIIRMCLEGDRRKFPVLHYHRRMEEVQKKRLKRYQRKK